MSGYCHNRPISGLSQVIGILSDFLWLDISYQHAANYCLSLEQSILDFGKAKATNLFLHPDPGEVLGML